MNSAKKYKPSETDQKITKHFKSSIMYTINTYLQRKLSEISNKFSNILKQLKLDRKL